jgi:hypothetical protein
MDGGALDDLISGDAVITICVTEITTRVLTWLVWLGLAGIGRVEHWRGFLSVGKRSTCHSPSELHPCRWVRFASACFLIRHSLVPDPAGSILLSSSRWPHRLWGPPSLLSNGYRGAFPEGKAAGAWSLPLTSK